MSQNTIENLEYELNTLKIEHSKKAQSIQNILETIKSGVGLRIVKAKKGLPFTIFVTNIADKSQNEIFTRLQQKYEGVHYPTSKESLLKDAVKQLSTAFSAIGEILDKNNLPNIYEFAINKSILCGSILIPLHIEVMLKVIYLNDEKNKKRIIIDVFLEN